MANPRYRRNRHNNMGSFLAIVVVLLLMAVVSISSVGLIQKSRDLKEKEAQLQAQIEAEQKRTEEIEEYAKYTQTKKYIEEVAKDTLGLVYPGEIIFKNDSDN